MKHVQKGAPVLGAGLLALFLASCTLTERQVPVQTGSPAPDLAMKVSRLEQALAELQRAGRPSGPDPELLRRTDALGKSVAELRQRLDSAEVQLLRAQDRTDQLERANRTDENRVRIEELAASLQKLSRKVQELEVRAARTPPAPAPAPVEKAPPPEKRAPSPQALYDEGYALLKQSKPEQAREKMLEFLRLYPEAPLAANAHFWIGESYYEQKQYEQAILEYDKVVQKYPKSEKVPSALLKQAFAFDALSDPADARILLKKILREYASSDQAAIAKKKLDSLGE
ncbi:MAG: tol-pal system protein YbgF [Deltaproteobacteria bacterium]|nr:tol-pal system protein YbgF [Deltaproteobacteria bacterium]